MKCFLSSLCRCAPLPKGAEPWLAINHLSSLGYRFPSCSRVGPTSACTAWLVPRGMFSQPDLRCLERAIFSDTRYTLCTFASYWGCPHLVLHWPCSNVGKHLGWPSLPWCNFRTKRRWYTVVFCITLANIIWAWSCNMPLAEHLLCGSCYLHAVLRC